MSAGGVSEWGLIHAGGSCWPQAKSCSIALTPALEHQGSAPACCEGWAGAAGPLGARGTLCGGLSGTPLPWLGAATLPAPCAPRGGQSPHTPHAASLPGTAKSSRSSLAPTRSQSRSHTNACTGCAPRSPTPAATSTTTRTTSSSSRWARGFQDPGWDSPSRYLTGTAPLLQILLPLGTPRGH